MNEIVTMNLNEREKEYFDYLDGLSYSEFNAVIKSEITKIFDMVRNPKVKTKSKQYTGIFEVTPNRIKYASGVRYGIKEDKQND